MLPERICAIADREGRTPVLSGITLGICEAHRSQPLPTCPAFRGMMWGPKARHALSRSASVTVCDQCGMEKSLEYAGMVRAKPLMKGCAIALPSDGGGAWAMRR